MLQVGRLAVDDRLDSICPHDRKISAIQGKRSQKMHRDNGRDASVLLGRRGVTALRVTMQAPTVALPGEEEQGLAQEQAPGEGPREDEFLWIELGARAPPAVGDAAAASVTPHSPVSAPDIQAHLAQLEEERLASQNV
eukprot:COSAG06_NODE_35789_length_455_cov_1.558989_1_plen_137_part_01